MSCGQTTLAGYENGEFGIYIHVRVHGISIQNGKEGKPG